jgi:hypothetical protein
MLTCIVPSAIELACFLVIRKKTFRAKAFYACLAAITLFFALFPLVLTSTSSFGAAREGCYARTVIKLKATYLNVDSPEYDPNWNEEDNFDDAAGWRLFPVHSFNFISTVVSLWFWGVAVLQSPQLRCGEGSGPHMYALAFIISYPL